MRKYWTMFLRHVFKIHPSFLSKKDAIKYAGQHVCIKSLGSRKVVSANANPRIAVEEARKKGYKDAVCMRVFRPDETQIYCSQAAGSR